MMLILLLVFCMYSRSDFIGNVEKTLRLLDDQQTYARDVEAVTLKAWPKSHNDPRQHRGLHRTNSPLVSQPEQFEREHPGHFPCAVGGRAGVATCSVQCATHNIAGDVFSRTRAVTLKIPLV